MSVRFTETEKWNDKWFRALSKDAKILFVFICDRCDIAGFYELDEADIEFRTGVEPSSLQGAVKDLKRGLLGAKDWVWVKNFLQHQKNLPLNPSNNAHKGIIFRISKRLNDFPGIPEYLGADKGLFSPIGKGKSKGKGNKRGECEGGVKDTWMTPYGDLWLKAYGGEMNYAKHSAVLQELEGKHGQEKLLAALKNYFGQTSPQYINLHSFKASFGTYAGTHSNEPLRKSPRDNAPLF